MPLDGETCEVRSPILETAYFCRSKGKYGECLLLKNDKKKCDESICPKNITRFVSICRDNGFSLFFADNSTVDEDSKEKNLDIIMTKLRMHLDFLMDSKLKRPPFLDIYVSFSDA